MKKKWIFDCDGVLYDDYQVHQQFAKILVEYISKYLGVTQKEVKKLTIELKQKYSTDFSILAYSKEFDINFFDLVKNTYLQLDFSMIVPDQQKIQTLDSLDGKKFVFTANPSSFAKSILDHAGLLKYFSMVIGMEEVKFISKNNLRAYLSVNKLIEESSKEDIYFCDDSIENLNLAKEIGWKTILFNPKLKKNTCHITIENFEDLLKL